MSDFETHITLTLADADDDAAAALMDALERVTPGSGPAASIDTAAGRLTITMTASGEDPLHAAQEAVVQVREAWSSLPAGADPIRRVELELSASE